MNSEPTHYEPGDLSAAKDHLLDALFAGFKRVAPNQDTGMDLIDGPVLLALGPPDVSSLKLLLEDLLMVDPQVNHREMFLSHTPSPARRSANAVIKLSNSTFAYSIASVSESK